jgi:DNA-binding response OmpR family regulator
MKEECILIVEDERAVARGLEYGLKSEGYHVIWVDNGEKALSAVQHHDPQLVLLDIRLPDISGFDVCKKLRMEGKRMPILMLTARDEEVDKVLGLELGADDYVVKPYSLRELISRIRALLRRAYGELSLPSDGDRIQFGNILVDMERLEVQKDGQRVDLTPTEFRMLRILVSNPNRPYSRDTLIEKIWGYTSDIGSTRTIDVHIRHLRKKLEVDPANPRWIVTVRGVGYKFSP